MSNIIEDDKIISKERMLTAICLIMILEHKTIDLEELIRATGMSFHEARKSVHNLSMLNLISVEPIFRDIPKFKIKNIDEANKFLKMIGF